VKLPTEILHELAGLPAFAGCQEMPGVCAICARWSTRSLPYQKWQGANFTDQNKIAHLGSDLVCEACAWSHSWVVPPGHPAPAPGKKGVCLRHFTHLWCEDGYLALNKADKPAILSWLRKPKLNTWFAAIADSGQKHILPLAPMNPAGAQPGIVQFEERRVEIGDWRLVDDMVKLLTLGVTKEELFAGTYRRRTMVAHTPEILVFEHQWSAIRGGHWYALSLWLAQRGEI